MQDEKISRINELYRLSKERQLTKGELDEQKKLRTEYAKSFRQGLQNVLSNTYIQRPDGTKEKIKPKN